jgi:hypothetical protein
MPGAGRTRSLVCKKGETHTSSSGKAETIRHSLRNGFTAYSALSLVSGLFSHHRPGLLARDLIPASGDQDHTAWPYASVHSPAAPKASIAARTTNRDDRETPLMRAG